MKNNIPGLMSRIFSIGSKLSYVQQVTQNIQQGMTEDQTLIIEPVKAGVENGTMAAVMSIPGTAGIHAAIESNASNYIDSVLNSYGTEENLPAVRGEGGTAKTPQLGKGYEPLQLPEKVYTPDDVANAVKAVQNLPKGMILDSDYNLVLNNYYRYGLTPTPKNALAVIESANESLSKAEGNADNPVIDREGAVGDNKGKEILPKTTRDFRQYMTEVGKRSDLTNADKVALLQEAYEALGDGNRTDVTVPADIKFLKENGFKANGYPDYDWPDRWGFSEDVDSITRENNALPDIMDRNGSLGGNSITELPADRAPYTYDEMSLPYIRNSEANHRAVYANTDGYYFDVIDAIRHNDLDGLNALLNRNGIESIDEIDFARLRSTYSDFIHDAESREINKDATYGLYGHVDKWINKKTGESYLNGGAPQFTLPLTVKQLIELGIYQ